MLFKEGIQLIKLSKAFLYYIINNGYEIYFLIILFVLKIKLSFLLFVYKKWLILNIY